MSATLKTFTSKNMLINDDLYEYINEESHSLLSEVDVDEVDDDSIDTHNSHNLKFDFTSGRNVDTISDKLKSKVSEFLEIEKSNNRISDFSEPELSTGDLFHTLSFSFSQSYDIHELNNALVKILRIIISMTISGTFHIKSSSGQINCNLQNIPARKESCHSFMVYDEGFYDFFKEYGFNIPKETILKSFIASLVKNGVLYCLDTKNWKLYSLYIANLNFENGSFSYYVKIVKTDGSFLTDDCFKHECTVFNSGYSLVKSVGFCNFIDTNGNYLLSNADKIKSAKAFKNGYATFTDSSNTERLIDTSGKEINNSGKTFSSCDLNTISEGFIVVKVIEHDDLFNYLNLETGELLSETYFKEAYQFYDGYGIILNSKSGFIDKNGKIVYTDDSVTDIMYFKDGIAPVEIGCNNMNYINTDGLFIINNKNLKIITCNTFSEGFGRIEQDDGTENFVDKDGNILYNRGWFLRANDFKEGFAVVKTADNKENFLKTDGTLLFANSKYTSCNNFHNGYGIVNTKASANFVDTSGNLISNNWFNSVESFHCDRAKVSSSCGVNFIKPNGETISSEWFMSSGWFHFGFATVRRPGTMKWNYIDTEGKILLENDVDICDDFNENGTAMIQNNGMRLVIDRNGNIISFL